MKSFRPLLSLVFVCVTTLLGCGGGGGGSGSSPCDALRVSGGEECSGGVPSVAAVLMFRGEELGTCTGALISQTAVLTAAHCVTGAQAIQIAVPGYDRLANRVSIHPGYRRIRYGSSLGAVFDLAIVKFAEPIPVAPAPLLFSKASPIVGENVIAYGVGVDEKGSDILDRLRDGETLLKASTLTFAGITINVLYETISDGSGNTCKGDSGGPVVAKNDNGQYGIVAVTSFSPLVSDERPCIPTEGGTLAVQSSVQNVSAANFILSVVPDAAIN